MKFNFALWYNLLVKQIDELEVSKNEVKLWIMNSGIKILIGCIEEEKQIIYQTHNETEYMKGILIRR